LIFSTVKSYEQYCGLALALDEIGDRWTLLVVRELLVAPRRFSDLAAHLPGIASNLLTERLQGLEAQGLVRKRELPKPARATVYELTESGEALSEVVHALMRWGGRFMRERRDGHRFFPEWLAVSLNAIRPPPGWPRARVVVFDVVVPEGPVRLVLGAEGVRVAIETDGPVRAVVRGVAEGVYGVAVGALPVALAGRAFQLEGPDAEVLARWLQPAPTGARRGRSAAGRSPGPSSH
jgi:DNA-binding HxlR family transcriptional regulator